MTADAATGTRLLLLETSGTVGRVGVALDAELRAEQPLDEQRRHARDLAPAVQRLLTEQGWRPADLAAVLVSQGPGSYTGLRVGLMSAKTLAYATGCRLIAVPTLAIVADQAAAQTARVEVIADAQQDRVYVQRFQLKADAPPEPVTPLEVLPASAWHARLSADFPLSGPGLERWHERLPSVTALLPSQFWRPGLASLLRLGLAELAANRAADPMTLEPLYARPSSAEEKWNELGRP
ncbi:MAG TPA: tRNA (adenosine(37)-N6)-threonylcarbamoyltransferase complex dimerization subunit type 1 TsaB [Gemmatales bacterium]|nr:tRNA (adenosine(37)-N6)-threonylcarbamoyltransferase complex dimerization subunit type 1 TsaB [Gemmatales bacterium]